MIGDGEMACSVVRHWNGAEGISVSVMDIGVLACTREALCTEAEATLHLMTGIGTDVGRFSPSDALFEVTSFVSSASGSQKKENSDVTLFDSSASEFQKNEKLETGFGHEDTGNVVIFVGEAIFSDLTCCISAVGTGTLVTLSGEPTFSVMIC